MLMGCYCQFLARDLKPTAPISEQAGEQKVMKTENCVLCDLCHPETELQFPTSSRHWLSWTLLDFDASLSNFFLSLSYSVSTITAATTIIICYCFAGAQSSMIVSWLKLLVLLLSIQLFSVPSTSSASSTSSPASSSGRRTDTRPQPTASSARSYNSRDASTIRAVEANLLRILGLKSRPRPVGRGDIPPYMLELYQGHSSGQSSLPANTVRSFHHYGEFIPHLLSRTFHRCFSAPM